MPLKTVLESLDGIEPSVAEFYREHNGSFVLDIEAIDAHPDVVGLKQSRDKALNEKKTLAERHRELEAKASAIPEDFDPDEWDRYKAGAKETQEQKDERLERQRQRLEERHNAEKAALLEKMEAERSYSHRLLIDEGLTRALVNAGVGKEFMKAAHALIRPQVKVSDDDGDRKAIVETDLGPMSLDRFAADWANSEEGKPFIRAPSGGGAPGSSSTRAGERNPWSKEHWNMTEQGAIFRQDRAKAERMMKSAGMSDADIRKRMTA